MRPTDTKHPRYRTGHCIRALPFDSLGSEGRRSFGLLIAFLCNLTNLWALDIDDDVHRVATLVGTNVVMSGRSELHVTGTGDPIAGSTFHLKSADSWVFFQNILPSSVEANFLPRMQVNGAPAESGVNVRVVQYESGTVIIPHGPDFAAVELFQGRHFTGYVDRVEGYRTVEADSLGDIRSFRLRRGYMATLAEKADGTGTSRCYVAQDADLEISQLPVGLEGSVRFLRVFPWRWVAKKGICGNIENGLDVKWTYNWNLNRNSPLDWEYVPIRQTRWWPGLGEDWKARGATHLLGYNEPDRPDQANMTVAEAIAGWPDLLATGLRIGSPVVSDGGLSWLYSFIDQADAAGLRVDFVPVHYYRGYPNPGDAAGAATQFYNFLKDIHDRVKRPLWVTEWNNGANWSSQPDPTFAQQASAVAAMTDMLDNAPFVERYAIYNWVEDVRRVKWDDGSLTSAGVVYRDNASPMAYLQKMPSPAGPPMARYGFDGHLRDISGNGHEGSAVGTPSFGTGKSGQCLVLDGTDDSVRLPENLGDSTDFSFAAWVKWNGGGNWERIFDLGNGSADFIYLSPKSSSNQLRFNIRKGGNEQQVSTSVLPTGVWTHVAVTLGGNTGRIYVNGTLAATNTSMSHNPVDLGTRFNHIGRGQFDSDPPFNGSIDDACFFNTELSAAQVAAIAFDTTPPQFTSDPLPPVTATKHLCFTGEVSTGVTGGPGLRYRKIAGPAWLTVSPSGQLVGIPGDDDGGINSFLFGLTNTSGSTDTAELEVAVQNPDGLVARHAFDNSAQAATGTCDGTVQGGPTYVTGRRGNAIFLDGVDDHVVLPAGIGNHDAITFAAWVLWNGGGDWQRLFDFGNGQDEHLFLTPKSGNGRLRFSIENDNIAHFIESGSALPTGTWVHVAATLGANEGKLYVNGTLVASGAMPVKPSDFAPTVNYYGRSRFPSDPYFSGRLDEAIVFSRVLSAAEISALSLPTTGYAPVFSANPVALLPAATPGLSYARSVAPFVSDPDAGDTLVFRKISGPSWLAVSPTGVVSGAPSDADAGMNRFLVRATDSRLLATDVAVEIRVASPAAAISHHDFHNQANDGVGTTHGTVIGGAGYVPAIFDQAIDLDGIDDHVVLPSGFLNGVTDITIAARVRWDGGGAWQRIFDFGNNTNQFLCLTPRSGNVNNGLRFTIKNGGAEQQLNDSAPLPVGEWSHVAVTLSGNTGTLYLNGTAVDTKAITIDPADFSPTLNYLGKSLFAADPYFNGQIDDFRVFNRALAAGEVSALAIPPSATVVPEDAYVFWAAGIPFASGNDGQSDDPDGDGTVNLLEYLFCTDPLEHDGGGLPQASMRSIGDKTYLCLEARVRKNRPGITLIPHAASSLEGLSLPEASSHAMLHGPPVDDGDHEILTWRYDVAIEDSPSGKGFMRLRVVAE